MSLTNFKKFGNSERKQESRPLGHPLNYNFPEAQKCILLLSFDWLCSVFVVSIACSVSVFLSLLVVSASLFVVLFPSS